MEWERVVLLVATLMPGALGCRNGPSQPAEPAPADRAGTEEGPASGEDDVVVEHLLLGERLALTLHDHEGNPLPNREWYDGSFRETAEVAWQPAKLDDREQTVRMWRYLVIPNAPWIGRVGSEMFLKGPDGALQPIGRDAGFVALRAADGSERALHMHESVSTAGTLVGEDGERIFRQAADGTPVQIGVLAIRDLRLDSGETARRVLLTRGMAEGAPWEGEIGDVTYREVEPGRAVPVRRLEYRKVRLDDGHETFLLMVRPSNGTGPWVGVHRGRVYRQP
ncbi:MAG: hypothetical protein JXB32_15975 [Deltaproteobacteria bacterium]|nr:hypothetical protein [Deltaproteobacteria bacterium]